MQVRLGLLQLRLAGSSILPMWLACAFVVGLGPLRCSAQDPSSS